MSTILAEVYRLNNRSAEQFASEAQYQGSGQSEEATL
jgi:hypothetical protein